VYTCSRQSGEETAQCFFIKFLFSFSLTYAYGYIMIIAMKRRQLKGAKYHKALFQIPDDLWKKIQKKAEVEYKSYTSVVVEILRDTFKSQ